MDFFINHIGWFVGIFFIGLFAIVGYYADKKEQSEQKNKKNDIDSLNNDEVNDTKSTSNSESFIENYTIDNQNPTKTMENTPQFGDDDFIYKEDKNETNNESVDYSINVDGTNDISNMENNFKELEWNDNEVDNAKDYSETYETSASGNNENIIKNIPEYNLIDNNDTVDMHEINSSINDENINQQEKNINEQDEKNNAYDIENTSNININKNEIPTNIVTDGFSTVEDIHMTLDDLENKNELDVTNDSLGVTASDDGYVDDYNEEYEFDNEVSDENENLTSININDELHDTEKQIDISEEKIKEDINEIDNQTTAEEKDASKNDEIENDFTNKSIFPTENSQAIPEITSNENINNSLDLYDDNTSDDIWKF